MSSGEFAGSEGEMSTSQKIVVTRNQLSLQVESAISKLKPFLLYRWIGFGVFFFLFVLRMVIYRSYYAVGYMAGLYMLNCLVLFLSPKFDPDFYGEDVLPGADLGESKPFVRKMPEFVFWTRVMSAILIAHFCAFIPVLNPPVYGPLLFVYFILVTVVTFRVRIAHMIRYRYLPFNIGKPKYKKEDN